MNFYNEYEEDIECFNGNILWHSQRTEMGVIVDEIGNEFYFDKSVLPKDKEIDINRKAEVSFCINKNVKECLCAKDVKII